MEYCPDRWLVVKITTKETGKVHYRVFATWHGGYLGSDSWKLNSDIIVATEYENPLALKVTQVACIDVQSILILLQHMEVAY